MEEDDYGNLTKEQLIEQIRKLKCHVKQLRNVIAHGDEKDDVAKKPRKGRPFDFSAHQRRHVALKFTYAGWDYQGLVVQEDCNNTIEDNMFRALTVTKLVEDRATSNYHRCGRTDKGVSAFSQVISLDLRSNGKGDENEIEYCKILNRVLPKGIRVLAWAPVADNFSARFDCIKRSYKYFLPKANIDVQRMVEGGLHLIGTHDFRNFCKSDGKKSTVRTIYSVDVEVMDEDMLKIIVRGQSFVWHQIRCIVAILVLVGVGKEQPELVKKLLDVETYEKPSYGMAADYPLVLFEVEYENVNWIFDEENKRYVTRDLRRLWTEHAIKSKMLLEMIREINFPDEGNAEDVLTGTKTRIYRKLLPEDE